MSWHHEFIAAKLAAVRAGRIRRLIVNVPPRYLKSLLGSVAFPAWCLGRRPGTQIICASYAQDFADKLARDCRRIIMCDWFERAFPTRLSAQRQAVGEFETTQQGCRLATSVGGVLTAHGTINRLQRFCGFCNPEVGESGLDYGLFLDSREAGLNGFPPSARGQPSPPASSKEPSRLTEPPKPLR